MVVHGQGDFGPFGFGQVASWVTGAEALEITFGTAPPGLFFDSQGNGAPVFGIS
jgi:hypothetical protein